MNTNTPSLKGDEARAREVLAAEYERDDMGGIAAMIRAGGDGHMATETHIRAMLAFSHSAGEGLDARALLADMLGVPEADARFTADGIFDFDRAVATLARAFAIQSSPPSAGEGELQEAIARVSTALEDADRYESVSALIPIDPLKTVLAALATKPEAEASTREHLARTLLAARPGWYANLVAQAEADNQVCWRTALLQADALIAAIPALHTPAEPSGDAALTERLLAFVLRCSAENPAAIGSARKACELLESLGIPPREPGLFFHTEEADLADARQALSSSRSGEE